MARSEPTPKIDVMGNLALDPVNAISDLTESKLQKKLFIKPPNWDSPEGSIELLAIENDREHKSMLQLQDEMLDRVKHQSVINTNRIDELYKMQIFLRHRFIEATNFFKQCDDKKKNAESKVFEEKKLHTELKQTIQKHKNDIEVLAEFRKVLKKTVSQFEPYETVIKEVVAKSDLWTSVKDFTARCDALMTTQEEVGDLRKIKLEKIEKLRQKMVKLSNDAASTVLGLNNQLSELEREYGLACSECFKWEKIIVNAKDCVLEQNRKKNLMLDEIHNMYRLMCRRRGVSPLLNRLDVEQQLDFIKDEIEILQQVVKKCNRN